MLSKNEVKYIQSLFHKKTRDQERLFIAEGTKLADEFISNGWQYKKIYATKDWLDKNLHAHHATEVSEAELKKISQFTTPHEVVLIAEKKPVAEKFIFTGKITVVLDGVQDPGNLGTIIRICDWFGVNQIVASEDTADQYNAKVVQASMGSIMRVSILYGPACEAIKNANVTVYGAVLSGKDIFSMHPLKEGIIVIGNESKGIREPLLSMMNEAITIPRKGQAESLNAAVATGIILSQLTR